MANQNQTNPGRVLLGLVLISIGVLYAFDYWHIIPNLSRYIFSWGSLFVLIGVVNLASRRKASIALLFIAGGIYFYVQEFVFGYRVGWNDIWPIALIVIGISLIFRASSRRRVAKDPNNPSAGTTISDDSNSFDDVAIFGGGEKVITSQDFQGGKITAIFGGSDIDLTQAKIQNGPAVVDMFVMFGGATIFAPKDWNVNIQLTPIFGGFSDKRFNISPDTKDPNKELIVKGLVLFGGGEIKGR